LGIDSWTKRLILKVTTSHYDPVPETFAQNWETTHEELLQAGTLMFDLWVRQKAEIYCDASAKVYTTALYLRTEIHNKVRITLLAAKARVTPIKSTSILRSELDACVLGHYNQALGLNHRNIYYYTDSTNALCWILSSAKDLIWSTPKGELPRFRAPWTETAGAMST